MLSISFAVNSCSGSIEEPTRAAFTLQSIDNLEVAGTFQRPDCESLYFRTIDGSRSAGVFIREVGDARYISIVGDVEDSSVELDAFAVLTAEYGWERRTRVDIPISEDLLSSGGEMTFILEDSTGTRNIGGHGYSPSASGVAERSAERPSQD